MNVAVKECGVCSDKDLELLWDLPNLPFTERFGRFEPLNAKGEDQALLICRRCGHVQLGIQISPEILYDSTYSFRTGQSASATMGTAVFVEFLSRIAGGRRFRSALDIGGNDQYLAKILQERADNVCVVDPVCVEQDGQMIDGVKIIGRFIGQVDLNRDLEQPDLVVCRHTLEHIADPRQTLVQLLSQCRDDSLFVFEIPCIEGLSEALRFDAIFHQHLHYFDLPGLQRLVAENGGRWLGHSYNHQGSCGGALLFAFEKAPSLGPLPQMNVAEKISWMRKRIGLFKKQMDVSSEVLSAMPSPPYGYGASLMLATLAYHMKTDFSNLECILDDDPGKNDLGYANLPVKKVKHTLKVEIPADSFFIVTSLENTRPILKRIVGFSPRRILNPLIT